ncbi:MAG: YitT family protein [Candidatus Poseidoniales archaeon]
MSSNPLSTFISRLFIRPKKEAIPTMPWSADDPFLRRPKPSTMFVLIFGLTIFGLGDAVIVSAVWGVTPWTVLAMGLAEQLGTTIGRATFLVSIIVLALWIPLREKPGIGTLLNIIIIAAMIDIALPHLPTPTSTSASLLTVIAGTALIAIGSGFYLTANLGPGPRDGWMTGLHRKTGISIGIVRTVIECTALLLGWMLGGDVGFGTLVFAFTIGPMVSGVLWVLSKKKI